MPLINLQSATNKSKANQGKSRKSPKHQKQYSEDVSKKNASRFTVPFENLPGEIEDVTQFLSVPAGERLEAADKDTGFSRTESR